jgi:hypothetical protein
MLLFDIRPTECDAVSHRRDGLLYTSVRERREFYFTMKKKKNQKKKPYTLAVSLPPFTAAESERHLLLSSSLSLSSA